jgi:S-formylglutathione hydrolase FrmB
MPRPAFRSTAVAAVLAGAALTVPAVAHSAVAHRGAANYGAADHGAANDGIVLHSADGIKVHSVRRIGARQLLATVTPNALRRPITVRILLPVGYGATPARRYPVLYLYPGTSGHSYDWMTAGQAPKTTRRYPLITVSSDIGFNGDGGGWFTNWVDKNTKLGPSQWETYDIHELVPWIDTNLATISSRAGRAVAGLSQGGYGATELAARHPDMFTEMASFSGAPEIERDLTVRAGSALIIGATMVGLNGVGADAPFGPHGTDEINWKGHDPAELIGNLRGMALWFATADGLPGKYDDPITRPGAVVGAGAIESLTHISTDTFLMHLRQAGLPATVYDYGAGTHSWPYWARDLRRFIGPLMHRFDHPATVPATAFYSSIEPRWSQWGWRFRAHRAERLQFATLSLAGPAGFRLAGSGRPVILTPPHYLRHHRYRVVVGHHSERLETSATGRLRIVVPLGPKLRQVAVRIGRPETLLP